MKTQEKTKHTPGPWTLHPTNVLYANYSLHTAEGLEILNMQSVNIRGRDEVSSARLLSGPEAQANARLIAASPAMFALCQRVAELADGTSTDAGVRQNLREIGAEAAGIITKVEGK